MSEYACIRKGFRPAFDMPTTPAEARAVLSAWGNPTTATFSVERAKRCAELLTAPSHPLPEVEAVLAELVRATTKFPTWPTDPLHASGVVQEESGELAKAVLQAVYEPHKSTLEDVASEAVQTAAMALRFLASIQLYDWTPGAQHKQGAT